MGSPRAYDDACCGQFAFGSATPAAWRTADLAAHRVHATVFDAAGRERYARDGEGRALLGDPLTALTWLANELSALGIGLRAGDWASCGTCMVPLEVLPGDRVVADYGTFGRIEWSLSDWVSAGSSACGVSDSRCAVGFF